MIEKTTNARSDSLAAQHGRFDACLERRNRAEFIAGGIAIVFLVVSGAIGFWGSTDLADRIAALGLILVAVGLGFTLWRLNRHVALQRRATPDKSPKAALVERLQRERDLLRSVWAWYVGPIVPGFLLAWGGMVAGGSLGTAIVGIAISVAAIAWIVRANSRAAAEFDDQLHELEPATI
jgi:hypothetical protein